MFYYSFTKYLQGELFVKFCEVIMGCKHIDTIKMGPPSTKERVGNMEEVESIKEEINPNIKTKD